MRETIKPRLNEIETYISEVAVLDSFVEKIGEVWQNLHEETTELEVRLNLYLNDHEGELVYDIFFWWGDPCFDTDHRGVWSYGTVTRDMDKQDLNNLFEDMRKELVEQLYSCFG